MPKLLLVEDVEHLGRSGDIVTVRPGYARNFLLPQGFGIIADKQALSMQSRLQEERKKRALVDKKEAEVLAKSLEEITLSTKVKIDQEGRMYGSVSALDVIHMLKEQHNIALEKKAVQLKHAIKETGVYPLTIKLKEEVVTKITLEVIPEELPEQLAVKEEKAPRGKKPRGEGRKKKEDKSEEHSDE